MHVPLQWVVDMGGTCRLCSKPRSDHEQPMRGFVVWRKLAPMTARRDPILLWADVVILSIA